MIACPLGATTRRSSDLSRHRPEVFVVAENHSVTVTRRDGEPLVLMSQREADGRVRLLQLTAQLLPVALEAYNVLRDERTEVRAAKALLRRRNAVVGGITAQCDEV